MSFKSDKQRRAVMAMILKQLRTYYKQAQKLGGHPFHRILINPKAGLVHADTSGVHYHQMQTVIKEHKTKAPWLATVMDVKNDYPGVWGGVDLKAFRRRKKPPPTVGHRRLGNWEYSDPTEKEKAFVAEINRRFRKIYGYNR